MGERRDRHGVFASGGPVLYPFLAAVFPILSVLSSNAPSVPLSDLVIPIPGMLVATALLWLALVPVLRDRLKRGLMVLGLIALFWSYGAVLDTIRGALHRDRTFSTAPRSLISL